MKETLGSRREIRRLLYRGGGEGGMTWHVLALDPGAGSVKKDSRPHVTDDV